MSTSSTHVGLSTPIARSPRIVQSELDGEVTMMSVDTGKYYALASVGARIWSLIEQPTEVGVICDRLTAQYRVEPEQCAAEVLAFITQMVDEGVAVVATNTTQ